MSDDRVIRFNLTENAITERLIKVECAVQTLVAKIDEHTAQQRDDNRSGSIEIDAIKVRLDRLEGLHAKEDAVKAAMSKWVQWFYGIICAVLGVLFSEAMRRLPLRLAIFAGSAVVASAVSFAASAAVYYVAPDGNNANAGTLTAPWSSIAYASTKVVAGDTVVVKSGTYATSIRSTASGTANARITYSAEPRNSVTITPPANNTLESAWEQAGNYVTIDGFNINGAAHQSGTRWLSGIKITGTYNNVQGNNISNIGLSASCSSSSHGILATESAANTSILGNFISDIGPTC